MSRKVVYWVSCFYTLLLFTLFLFLSWCSKITFIIRRTFLKDTSASEMYPYLSFASLSLYPLNFWKIILLDIEFMTDSSFLLQHLKKIFITSDLCIFRWEICWHSNCCSPISNASFLCGCFQDFFFVFVFRCVMMICQSVISVGLPNCGLLIWICRFMSFFTFGSFQPLFFLILFQLCLSLFFNFLF